MSRWCLPGIVEDRGGNGHRVEGVGLGLQGRQAARLDLVGAGGQAGEEGIDVRAHISGGAEAGVRRHFVADPALDRLVRVEVGAVGRQPDQPHVQVGHGEIGARRATAARRGVVPEDDERRGVAAAQMLQAWLCFSRRLRRR